MLALAAVMASSLCSMALSAVALTLAGCAASPTAPDAPIGVAASSATTSMSTTAVVASSVFELTNVERVRAGLPPLRANDRLVRAAQLQSDQMVRMGVMEHVLPGAPLPSTADRLAAAGYSWQAYAENIATGQSGAVEVVRAWMQSTSHRESILNPTYTELGVGYAIDGRGRPYYTQVFGRPAP